MDEQENFRLADALGAGRVEDVATGSVDGPLDLLALREGFDRRLRSRGVTLRRSTGRSPELRNVVETRRRTNEAAASPPVMHIASDLAVVQTAECTA